MNAQKKVIGRGGKPWPIIGKKGQTLCVSVQAAVSFRARRWSATDTSAQPGRGTEILRVVVGPNFQFVPDYCSESELTAKERLIGRLPFLSADFEFRQPFKGAIMWPKFSDLLFEVRFLEDCEWSAVLEGEELP